MIKSIVGFINGTITMKAETNKSVHLSDGTQWNKHKFHENRTLIKAFMLREVSTDPAVQAMQAEIAQRKEAARAGLADKLKTVAPVPDPAATITPADMDWAAKPSWQNRRFICGFTGDGDAGDKFVMIFWSDWMLKRGVPNSHSNLEDFHQKATGRGMHSIQGGFYMNSGHNNSADANTVYLFGRSDTYGHFEDHIPAIRKYAEENGFRVVIGKTNFTYDRTPTDVISEHFTDYDASVENRLPF